MTSNTEKTPGPADAPCLRVTLQYPTEISKISEAEHLKINVTYEGFSKAKDQDDPPVTFHKYGVTGHTDLNLYQLSDGEWTRIVSQDDEVGGCAGFALLDAPPIMVKVAEDEQFLSLGLGESVVADQHALNHKIPGDAKPGDRFRLVLEEARVEWWSWGDRERHVHTEVYLRFGDWAGLWTLRPRITTPCSARER